MITVAGVSGYPGIQGPVPECHYLVVSFVLYVLSIHIYICIYTFIVRVCVYVYVYVYVYVDVYYMYM